MARDENQSPYFTPRDWEKGLHKEDKKRLQRIETEIRERERNLCPTPSYPWEIQRRRLEELEGRIAGLVAALAASERALAKSRYSVRALRAEVNVGLEASILRVLSKQFPRNMETIRARLVEDYGEVKETTVRRALARLVKLGDAEPVIELKNQRRKHVAWTRS